MIRKFALGALTALTLAGATLASAAPAAADPWHHRWDNGPRWGYGPPIVAPYPDYDQPRCEMKRRWVHDYYGWHRAWRRVCY